MSHSHKTDLLLVIFSLFIIFGLTACGQKEPGKDLMEKVTERGKIVAGVKFDSKPFGYLDENQKLEGFDIDLVREIAKRVLGDENDVEFQQVTSSSRILSLTSGAVDLVAASMTINNKRKRVIDFSTSYYVAGQALMVPVDSDIHTIRDLNNKTVVIILGTTAEDSIRNLAPQANILGFRTYTDAFSALKAGRADALIADDAIIAGLMSDSSGFKMLQERYTQEPYGVGFKKGIETRSFEEAINSAIESIKVDGTLDKIRRKWIPSS